MDITSDVVYTRALRNLPSETRLIRFGLTPIRSGYCFSTSLVDGIGGDVAVSFLFPTLSVQMLLLEQLACGLGLGMMAVAALTLGVKLCGWHGYHLMFLATAAGAIAEIWRERKVYWTGIADGCGKMVHRPLLPLFLWPERWFF